jgi:hypothetical protein
MKTSPNSAVAMLRSLKCLRHFANTQNVIGNASKEEVTA